MADVEQPKGIPDDKTLGELLDEIIESHNFPKVDVSVFDAKNTPRDHQSPLAIEKIIHNNIPVFRVSAGRDTGKAEIAVGKALEFLNKGVSDSVWVTEPTTHYFDDRNHVNMAAIDKAYGTDLDHDYDTVVLGAAHRLGVYIARVLNCSFYPAQFVSFVEKWDELEKADEPFVAGFDYDADPLIYVCTKPSQILTDPLGGTKSVVIVRSTDKSKVKRFGRGFIHSSVFEQNCPFKAPRPDLKAGAGDIPDWEYGLFDEQIKAVDGWCKERKGKRILIEGSITELYRAIPLLINYFYKKNNVSPQKFVFNAFWIAHPYYEIETLALPICFYKLDTPQNREFIAYLQKKTGITDAELYINDFGGDTRAFFEDYLVKSGHFNIREQVWGADSWDNPNSSSRLIAEKLKNIKPREWDYLTIEELEEFFRNIKGSQ